MSTTDTTAAAAPPAGWYPDPTGRHERRWWDGESWTHEVADPAAPGEEGAPLDDPAAEPVAEEPVATVEAEPVEPQPEAEPEPEPERFDAEPRRLPPEQRASTGAGLTAGPSRRGLVLTIVAAVVLLGAIL